MNDTQRALWSERAAITAAWVAGILMFFPIFWMALTSFKTELEAIAVPPTIIFDPTLENFSLIQERTDYTGFAWNSIITSVGGTALAMAIAVPAAYAMAFFPGRQHQGHSALDASTKMMPAVGVLMPIYLISQKLGLLDTRIVLVVIYAMINLPIVIWLLFTYFREIRKKFLKPVEWTAHRPSMKSSKS